MAHLKMTTFENGTVCLTVCVRGPPKSSCYWSQWKTSREQENGSHVPVHLPSCLPHLRHGLPFEILGARSLHEEPECCVTWECRVGHFARKQLTLQTCLLLSCLSTARLEVTVAREQYHLFSVILIVDEVP